MESAFGHAILCWFHIMRCDSIFSKKKTIIWEFHIMIWDIFNKIIDPQVYILLKQPYNYIYLTIYFITKLNKFSHIITLKIYYPHRHKIWSLHLLQHLIYYFYCFVFITTQSNHFGSSSRLHDREMQVQREEIIRTMWENYIKD